MPNNITYYIDDAGLILFAEEIAAKINREITDRMVTVIDEDSTNIQIASAKAVYDMLTEGLASITNIHFEVIEDDLPLAGTNNTIYLISREPDNIDNNVYDQWIYVGDRWLNLGACTMDLGQYWAKSEFQPVSAERIQEICDNVFGA